MKINAVLEKITMHCPRGPEDYRKQKGKAVEKQAGQRLKRIESGLSIRVGCGVHFATRRQPDTADITEILYYEWDHSDGCKASNVVRIHALPELGCPRLILMQAVWIAAAHEAALCCRHCSGIIESHKNCAAMCLRSGD